MIVTETKNGITHIYSDEGRKVRMKGTKVAFNNAYEEVGKEHEWEEVDDE